MTTMRTGRGSAGSDAEGGGGGSGGRAPGRSVIQCRGRDGGEIDEDTVPMGALTGDVGGGAPLPGPLKARMSDAFDFSFADVRVHEGGEASALGAEAFTSGKDVHFAPGRYQPDSTGGQELIGHELAHVVQQSQGRVASPVQSKGGGVNQDPALESEADALGARAASPVADLATRVGSAAGLRATLAASPGLVPQIIAHLASTDDANLNRLMAQAFPAPQPKQEKPTDEVTGKDPTDPAVALPAERTGDKTLAKGQMKWTLKAADQSRARVDIDFKPDESKVDAKNVSYLQTIIQQQGADRVYPGGTAADPQKEKARFTPLEDPTSKKYIDHFPAAENDPFYGAEWDQAAKKWKKEPGALIQVGSSEKGVSSTSAKMDDTPNLRPVAREGKGDAFSEFEAVPVVLETREPLGALKWGFKIKDEENAPLELTGGQDADCTDTPSADWGNAVTQYYAGKYETILDEFDIAKSDLKADHKTKLDDVATKMKANAALNVELGGACDHTGDEAFNQALSLKRAEAARDYLVTKGIDAARITVQSYSFDWARVEAEKGKSEGKNRRVQVLLRP